MSNAEHDLKLMTNTGRMLEIKKYTNFSHQTQACVIYHTNLESSITAA